MSYALSNVILGGNVYFEVIFSIKSDWNFHHNALTSVVSRFVDFEGLETEKHYHLFPFFRNIIIKKLW